MQTFSAVVPVLAHILLCLAGILVVGLIIHDMINNDVEPDTSIPVLIIGLIALFLGGASIVLLASPVISP